MEERLGWRLAAIVFLLAVLAGLFVWAGTVEPDPAVNNYADGVDISDNPDKYVGERVAVGGTVIETEPVTVEDEPVPGERITFVIENAAVDVAVGDHLSVYGTLQADNRVDATDTTQQESWETYYMYLVSFLAGLWVLGRLVNNWTVDTTDWTVVPRIEPLVSIRS